VGVSLVSALPWKIPWEKNSIGYRRKYPISLFNLGVFLIFVRYMKWQR
jgi:hypothetical protein